MGCVLDGADAPLPRPRPFRPMTARDRRHREGSRVNGGCGFCIAIVLSRTWVSCGDGSGRELMATDGGLRSGGVDRWETGVRSAARAARPTGPVLSRARVRSVGRVRQGFGRLTATSANPRFRRLRRPAGCGILGLGALVPTHPELVRSLSRQNVCHPPHCGEWCRGGTDDRAGSPGRVFAARRVSARWSRVPRLTDKPPGHQLRWRRCGVLRGVSRSAQTPSLPRRDRGRTRPCRCGCQSCDAHSRSRFLRHVSRTGRATWLLARSRWGPTRRWRRPWAVGHRWTRLYTAT